MLKVDTIIATIEGRRCAFPLHLHDSAPEALADDLTRFQQIDPSAHVVQYEPDVEMDCIGQIEIKLHLMDNTTKVVYGVILPRLQ